MRYYAEKIDSKKLTDSCKGFLFIRRDKVNWCGRYSRIEKLYTSNFISTNNPQNIKIVRDYEQHVDNGFYDDLEFYNVDENFYNAWIKITTKKQLDIFFDNVIYK